MQNIFMGNTNGGLLGKYPDIKVTKCEIQYSKTFRKSYWKTSLIQTSIIQNLSKSKKCFGPLEELAKMCNIKYQNA